MRKIDLMIIGAQKAGTTSLKNYLNEHPDLLGHSKVEFAYFGDTEEYNKGYEKMFSWYFPDAKNHPTKQVIAKNASLLLRENALKRLKEHNPDCKLVFVMRDPVYRAYSAYKMAVKDGWMDRDFEELETIIKNKSYDDVMYKEFIELGIYLKQIKYVLDYYKPENLRVYLFKDIGGNPQLVCEDIFKWLNVDSTFLPAIERRHNVSKKPKSLLFAKLINTLRIQQNPLKKLVKMILPYSLFSSIGNKIISLNKSDVPFAPIPENTEKILIEYFMPINYELADFLNREEYKNCIRIFDKNNWFYDAYNQYPASNEKKS